MCQLFIWKDFETTLLTLLGVSLVLWRRKADNTHSNPLFYGPSPLNSLHLHFQFPITSLLKILLEVVAIGRKNAGKDPDRAYAFKIYKKCQYDHYIFSSKFVWGIQNRRLFSDFKLVKMGSKIFF
jgi:hypothetical protein